ncbi:MAG: hypothetical protein QXD95_03570 [Nitrososphaeria archaeon]
MLENKKRITLCCLYLLFIYAFYIHVEAPVWMIIALLAINLSLFVRIKHRGSERGRIYTGLLMALSFIVIFLSFNPIFYDVWLQQLKCFNLSEPLSLLLTSKLTPGPWTREKYLTSLHAPLLNYLRVFQYVIILFPIILAIFKSVKKVITAKTLELGGKKVHSYLWLMILLTAFTDIAAYSVGGWISLKYVGLMFPILTVASLDYLKVRKWLKMVTLLILMFIVFSSAIFYLGSLIKGLTTFTDIEAAANWFFKYPKEGKILLTDVSTFGKFKIKATILNTSFIPYFYNWRIYEELFKLNYSFSNSNFSKEIDYLIVDYKSSNRPTQTIRNKYYEPLFPYLQRVNNKRNLNRIYDDGIIWIFESRELG